MRVGRLEITRFRGFQSLVLVPRTNVAVVGEPRAGRSDIISALRRVLDPRSIQSRPSEWDIHRPLPTTSSTDTGEDAATDPELTSIELSLLNLPEEVEQTLQERLELFDPCTGELVVQEDLDSAELGIRLRYVLQNDPADETLQHWVEYPKSGNRAPRSERDLIRAFVLDRNAPLQLRADGVLNRLASHPDPEMLNKTLQSFSAAITAATRTLTASDEIQAALELVVEHGAQLLQLDRSNPTEGIAFTADDGSLTGLLRTVQPTLILDAAGALPLSSHGSTTSAILAAAEAAAAADNQDAIVLADDFGDELDGASSEYLTARLRRRAGQLWLSTRRPEVLRAFEPVELVRLSRNGDVRRACQLSEHADRKERGRRRHLPNLLSSAMSTRTVVLVEGPHDSETYSAVSSRLFNERDETPLSVHGMRLVPVSALGGEGGKQELPKIGQLALDLGFAVRVVLDHDKPGTDDDLIQSLCSIADMVIRLPERAAVERAIVDGLSTDVMRTALTTLNDNHELGLRVPTIEDTKVSEACIAALKKKGGLHREFIDALPTGVIPPLATSVLEYLKADTPERPMVNLDPV